MLWLTGCGGEQQLEGHSWEGTWRTFWRDGQALMTLTQDGDQVRGTYRPGNGRIEGTRQGEQLVGQWYEGRREGEFVFALSPDGQSFVGRFANEEYWNGERIDSASFRPIPFHETGSPSETLGSLVTALNAIADNNIAASVVLPSLLVYDDVESSSYEQRQRRQLLKRILDLTTFRIWEAPNQGQNGRAEFVIRTQNSEWSFPLQFVETAQNRWRVLVPAADSLRRSLRRGLTALGFETYGAYAEAARNSPRGIMRQFLTGVSNWNAGGQEQALATMDLSRITPQLQGIEGPLAADYLRQIIDRVGYVIWQEIPNDADAHQPYVHYENAAGSIVIVPPPMTGTTQWLFSSETIRDAADIYDAAQELPVATGNRPEPLTDFFQVRQSVRKMSPVLLERHLWLANWQWIGLVVTLLVAGLLGHLGGRLAETIGQRIVAVIKDDEEGGARSTSRRLMWPTQLFIVGLVVLYCLRILGLRQDLAAVLGTTASLLIIGGVTALLYEGADVFRRWYLRRSPFKFRYVDEIMIVLVTGATKIVIVLMGILIAAGVIGLPYEGVVAGLGVGGLALAIAARDTISNFISAGILLVDRPFNQGDLIDVEGAALAKVQSVGMRSTRLRTQDDSLLVVPNHKLTDSIVNNFGKRRHRRIVLLIGLTYDTPREQVDAFVSGLRETFLNQPLADTELYIGLHEFSDSAYTIRLWGYLKTNDLSTHTNAQHQLMGDIIELADSVGVDFAFPTRTLHIASEPSNGMAYSETQEHNTASS